MNMQALCTVFQSLTWPDSTVCYKATRLATAFIKEVSITLSKKWINQSINNEIVNNFASTRWGEPITNSTHIYCFFVSSSSLCRLVCTQLKVANVDNITNKCRSRINSAQLSKKKSKTLDFKHLSILDNIYKWFTVIVFSQD